MTFSDDCPKGRSQLFTFPRRQLLQRTASAALLFFVPRPQSVSPTPENPIPEKYPKSQFRIGDRVVSPWLDDDDEPCLEAGEIVGICLHPKTQEWQYLINWTGGSGCGWMYPCFDGDLVVGNELRLVSHD
jgi:hypothetical protein